MLHTLWPTYGLTVTTPRLRLRLPDERELAALADLAGRGVHAPDERPFLNAWTEGSAEDRARFVLQEFWGRLAAWRPAAWHLGVGVFDRDGRPLGMVSMWAEDFRVVREVRTDSWLGLAYHRRGYGTEARLGLLTLAFDHLGAEAAVTGVFQDNHASQGVSRKLGYEPDGITRDALGDEVLVSDRLRLTAAKFRRLDRSGYAVEGIDRCRSMFTG